MATIVREKAGRKWTIEADPKKATRTFVIQLDGAGEDPAKTYTGIPKYGDAHPQFSGIFVTSVEFEEGKDADKRTVVATVEYESKSVVNEGSASEPDNSVVEEWGWDASTEEKELTTAADGTAVLNSAGDPFDSVPQVSAPAPVFTKVVKFKDRQSNVMAHNCKVNAAAVTIGGYSFPTGSLLCTVAEKRIIGNSELNYQYTVQLKYKSNMVKVAGANTLTDIGWDVAITDAGMRGLDDNNKLKLIRQVDEETGKPCTVTSPELLDGAGHAVTRTGGTTPTPYNFRFQAYETTTFPDWFYSEPPLNEVEDDE